MEKAQIQHLYKRAGFGILPSQLDVLDGKSKKAIVKDLFKVSKTINELTVPTPELDAYIAKTKGKIDKKDIRDLLRRSRSKHLELNQDWLQRMASAKECLRERMTFFWSNHFVVRSNNILYSQRFHNTLRSHALGNFKSLLIAISKEPAMLDYLNNQQNRKNRPNENFARELMELFTLGEGNYSEADIRQAARSFTGWHHDRMGTFKLLKKQHDYDEKTVFGKKGNFEGEDIIQLILDKPECAEFISRKIYAHFVNDRIDEGHVAEMATLFRKNYELSDLMAFVFASDWFYNSENIGGKIKSPVDFLTGLMQVVPFTMNKPKQLKYVERLLGQVLFEPPNVAGWAEGRSWIDANTMMVRLKLPSVLLKDGSIAFDVKGEFEDSFAAFNAKSNFKRKLDITKQWSVFDRNYGNLSFAELTLQLLGERLSPASTAFLESLEKNNKQDFCIQLMSLPEYQLC
ncbi:DUF1800 domain-containing protein [Aggregatimonas sangjinii]|uniref:DUF1800 domain-containing protein n=1 Tax=Aggregatimonas sangjinii TaxID=2583587 RepID=A0A5B7SP96_9FLAO|nr:DUF1800 domain-containing protein [Aggregatimonas sangjinii]QCW99218.1 DUF1800 domain-containing protein [Aggregatimonas sangjinii]